MIIDIVRLIVNVFATVFCLVSFFFFHIFDFLPTVFHSCFKTQIYIGVYEAYMYSNNKLTVTLKGRNGN